MRILRLRFEADSNGAGMVNVVDVHVWSIKVVRVWGYICQPKYALMLRRISNHTLSPSWLDYAKLVSRSLVTLLRRHLRFPRTILAFGRLANRESCGDKESAIEIQSTCTHVIVVILRVSRRQRPVISCRYSYVYT